MVQVTSKASPWFVVSNSCIASFPGWVWFTLSGDCQVLSMDYNCQKEKGKKKGGWGGS